LLYQKEHRFSFADFSIDPEAIAEYMGYEVSQPAPEPVVDVINGILDEVPALCDIRGGYIITEQLIVDSKSKTLRVGDVEFLTRNIVTHQLRNSKAAAWFVCTTGEALSGYTRKLMDDGDLLKGYAVDVLANITVDLAMDRIQENLKDEASEIGWQITNRYSPGYCGWDITEQKKLFSLLPPGFMGVSLSESALMTPIKSVSGIIGLGSDVRYNKYTCNLCDMTECMYRNKRVGDRMTGKENTIEK